MNGKHVIVVGAGITGASVAWHLARAGARVSVVEAGEAGGVATPASFAWINASWGNPEPYFRLRSRSMREWVRLARDVPDLPLRWCGSIGWDMPRGELDRFLETHAAWGYDIRPVDRAVIAAREPNLTHIPDFALYAAGEGAAEPVATARLLLTEAQRFGATVSTGLTVDALATAGGRVVGVVAGGDTITADEVVLAAGTAVPRLAATAGVAVMLDTPPGLIVQSRPHARLLDGIVLAEAAHLRQTLDGRIIAGADFGGADPGEDAAGVAADLFASVKAMLRGGEALEMERYTVGYRPTPADGFPIVGRPAGVDGLYLSVMHSGVTLAPAVGLFAAQELLDGARDPLLAPYGAARFDHLA